MIDAVTIAEKFLEKNALVKLKDMESAEFDIGSLNIDEYMHINQTPLALNYASS